MNSKDRIASMDSTNKAYEKELREAIRNKYETLRKTKREAGKWQGYGRAVGELFKKKDSALTPKEEEKIELLRFRMDNLLAPENIMNPDSVKVLQKELNKYVVSKEDKLDIDGKYGRLTHEAVKQFHTDKRYWLGHDIIDTNK